MNNFNFTGFRSDFQKAIADLEKQYKVKVDLGRITYNDEKFTAKMTTIFANESGEVVEEHVSDWNKHAQSFGLDKDLLNQTVVVRGEKITIIGLLPNRRKYPVLAFNGKKKILYTVNSFDHLKAKV